mgnify:CR=1 FL=1
MKWKDFWLGVGVGAIGMFLFLLNFGIVFGVD